MININDYNREDLIASCLMEAASVLSEGMQASEYQRKKENEARANKEEYFKRLDKRYPLKGDDQNINKATDMTKREQLNRKSTQNSRIRTTTMEALDAANRHLRRHGTLSETAEEYLRLIKNDLIY